MATVITNTSEYPYAAVVSIRSMFTDGRVSFGTGSLIGKNDVLTATHVVYQPDHGGYASSILVYPGAVFNGSQRLLESSPFGSYASGEVIAFPNEVFLDANHNTNLLTEIASDIAIIGLDQAVGFQTGWFGLAPEYNNLNEAIAIGYPIDSNGMSVGDVLAHSLNGSWITAYSDDGSELMGPGSSGGPLFLLESNLPSIIGVKSSGNEYVNYWADIDNKYEIIQTAIQTNDHLIGGSLSVAGSINADQFLGIKTNLLIDGLQGIDTVIYAGRITEALVSRTGNQNVTVVDAINLNQGDVLTNIERLQFADGHIALDVGPVENAGSLYMLYKAAFNRAPDDVGMGYWLSLVDAGKDIVTDIAEGFVRAPEFIAKYGSNPTNAYYVDQLYRNVLGREGEEEGVRYWNAELNTGKRSKAEVLVQFATVPEGAALVADLIANGIPYQEWVG